MFVDLYLCDISLCGSHLELDFPSSVNFLSFTEFYHIG